VKDGLGSNNTGEDGASRRGHTQRSNVHSESSAWQRPSKA